MSVSPSDIPGLNGPADDGQGSARALGGASADASRTSGGYKGQMTRANIALVLLFLGGAGAIYWLSLRKGPAKASAEQELVEAQVDSAIARISASPGPRGAKPSAGGVTRDLLKNFCAQVKERQIPAGELKKDPFVFVPPEVPDDPTGKTRGDGQTSAPNLIDPNKDTLLRATNRFATLELQSILRGKRPNGGTAIISNNLLTVGQKIRGLTVKEIRAKTVILTWQDKEFILEMP